MIPPAENPCVDVNVIWFALIDAIVFVKIVASDPYMK